MLFPLSVRSTDSILNPNNIYMSNIHISFSHKFQKHRKYNATGEIFNGSCSTLKDVTMGGYCSVLLQSMMTCDIRLIQI